MAWIKNRWRFLARHGELVALGLLVAAVSLINIVWISQDTRPQPGTDPNGYLIKTFEFVDRLREREGARLWQSITGLSIGDGRPPLYQLFSVPFICVLGRSEDAALAVNVIFQALLLLSTYGMGKLAGNGRAGLLAAFLVATYPPIANSSKIYLPHAATPACVALSLWLLLLLLKTRAVKIAWLFGASLAFGMLIQLQFLYLFPALTVVGLYTLLFQTTPRCPPDLKGVPRWLLSKLCDPFVLYGLLPAVLIAAGFTAAWYLPHSQAILTLRQGVIADFSHVTVGFSGVPSSFWWYARTAPGAISTVLALLLGGGLVVGTIKRRLESSVLVITFLATYSAFSLSRQVLGWFYFASALPVAAALTAAGVMDIRGWFSGRLLSAVVTVVCVGVAAFNFSVVTWGVAPWGRPIATALGAPLNSQTCLRRTTVAFCPNPARDEDWHVSDILRTILDDPECQARECHLEVVPLRDGLNSLVFECYLARDFPRSRERLRVSSAVGWRGAPGDGEWVVSDYVAYVPQLASSRSIRAELARFLASPPPVFADVHQEVASFALPGGWTFELIKRAKPLTVDMAIQLYEETLRSVPSHVTLYERLGYLHLRTEHWSRAEELFRQAAQADPTLGSPHRALGYLYQRQGLEDQAIVEFREAIEKEPSERKAYRYLADLFEARGDLQASIQVYGLAARNNPRLAWPYRALESVYVRANRLPEAVAAYHNALRVESPGETVEARLRDVHWSLASSLGTAKAYSDHTPLVWWLDETWVRPYPYEPDVLVGHSALDVEGQIRPDQIHLHPFGADQDTYLRFEVEGCPYDALQIGYGLADQVTGLSNGVGYTVRVSADEGNSYTVLWDETVIDSVWLSQTVPLMAYWGEDVTFELGVDALGDDGYDWLQTTVRLFPAVDVWDLATNLATVQVATTDVQLSWSPPSIPPSGGKGSAGAWMDGDGRPLVTVSQAPVQGTARSNQVQLHPFSDHQATAIAIVIANNPYTTLKTAYALADEAVARSNGVEYAVMVSTDGGRTFASLLRVEVSQNNWDAAMLDLDSYLNRDLTIKLVSSSQGDENYDWLQVTLNLLDTRRRG
jgi:tetratricopeptide (TPR) repeat protein